MNRISIFGYKVFSADIQEAITCLNDLIEQKKKGYISFLNAYVITRSAEDALLRDALQNALFAFADGISITIASLLLNGIFVPRIRGTDFFFQTCAMADRKGYSVFFLGAKEAVVAKTAENTKMKFPRLQCVGYHNGFFDSEVSVIRSINKAKPDILFLGMGTPKDLQWIYRNIKKVDITIALPVGNAFSVMANVLKRAPLWMQYLGLEWLYRLYQEPQRLWVRYLFGNTFFLYLLTKEALKRFSRFFKRGDNENNFFK